MTTVRGRLVQQSGNPLSVATERGQGVRSRSQKRLGEAP